MKIFEGEVEGEYSVYIKLETEEEIRALHVLANAFCSLKSYSAEGHISESDNPQLLANWPPVILS